MNPVVPERSPSNPADIVVRKVESPHEPHSPERIGVERGQLVVAEVEHSKEAKEEFFGYFSTYKWGHIYFTRHITKYQNYKDGFSKSFGFCFTRPYQLSVFIKSVFVVCNFVPKDFLHFTIVRYYLIYCFVFFPSVAV